MKISYEHYDSIDSTNNELRRGLGSVRSLPEFTVISADEQTAGRGRSGHVWSTPAGSAIATSMVLYPKTLDDARIPGLVIPAAIAVCDAVQDVSGLEAQIKWPNDILLSEKKISGILCERILLPENGRAVIIGIGLNVFAGSYPMELCDTATCIEEELAGCGLLSCEKDNRRRIIDDMIRKIWERFIGYYSEFCVRTDMSFLQEAYNLRLINAGRKVRVVSGRDEYEALAHHIDEYGRLIIEDSTGKLHAVDSGEVHVRGIYGYV